ncbi:MAG: DNA-binding protein [Thermoanaerobaculia bacterium]
MERRYILARDAAARIGVRTSTLRKWRTLGKGPVGWIHAGKTVVLYPVESLNSFLNELERKSQSESGERVASCGGS